MATAKDVLAVARKEIGVKESPANSNNVKYNTAYYGREVHDTASAKYPWCMVFQWWLFHQAEADGLFYGGGKTASCGTLMDYARAHGQWVTGGYRPGDIVIMDFPGNKVKTDHCGIVVTALTDGVRTIEGNTGVGNDSNGGEVMERTRPLSVIIGAYRPHYAAETVEKEDKPMTYKYLKDIPEKFRPIINQLMTAGIIQGDGSDQNGNGDVINLTHEQVRTLVFVYRGGGFDRKLMAVGLEPVIQQ